MEEYRDKRGDGGWMYLHGTSRINEQGHLEIGGCDTVDLAKRFGTPLYVMDEALIRQQMRRYIQAAKDTGLSFQIAYASKAFCTMSMCRIVAEEGLHLDVVSDGELYTALKAGFPPEKIHFHGNNKSLEELEMALDAGIGHFIIDNFVELEMLESIAKDKGKVARILLRLTPGIEAHTAHQYIQTGQADSKFGFDMASDQGFQAVQQAMKSTHLTLEGIHCHIGSQIFDTEGFRQAAQKMAQFAERCYHELGVTMQIMNLGGGFGVRYNEEDQPLPISTYVKVIADVVKEAFASFDHPLPEIWLEPGRSIVGEAGTTLYTIGTVKEIPGIRKYASVDGGMTDNLRPALYQAKYEAMLANRGKEAPAETVSIAGKCCESGDMLIWDLPLPKVQTGDLLAVSCTGAYNYVMASNYNRLRRPAVVFVHEGTADLVVRRETLEDLIRLESIPERMKGKEE